MKRRNQKGGYINFFNRLNIVKRRDPSKEKSKPNQQTIKEKPKNLNTPPKNMREINHEKVISAAQKYNQLKEKERNNTKRNKKDQIVTKKSEEKMSYDKILEYMNKDISCPNLFDINSNNTFHISLIKLGSFQAFNTLTNIRFPRRKS